MTTQEERLVAYLLDLLDAQERAEVDEALANDPALRAELSALADIWHLGAEAEVAPQSPPPGGLARLLDATELVSRFDEFIAPLAQLMDIALDKARELLGRLDDESAWDDSPMPWVKLMHLEPGPAAGVAMAGATSGREALKRRPMRETRMARVPRVTRTTSRPVSWNCRLSANVGCSGSEIARSAGTVIMFTTF